MSALLFVYPIAFRPTENRRRIVTARRPRRPPTCSSAPNFSADPSDQAWKDLARSLGSSDSAPPRPAPEWKDQKEMTSADEAKAWATWKSARDQQTPMTERDPRKETDFWRATAQELSEPPPSLADAPVDPNASSSEIWGLARGVTGEMSALQSKLLADLDRYNPEENTDQYRRIARELVGPADDEWETVSDAAELKRPSTPDGADVSPASGWNPDTDWRRFDDLRREEALKMEKDARAGVARDAQKRRDDAFEKIGGETSAQGSSDITYTDETGKVMTPEEVKKAMEEGAVFVDEAGSEILSTSDMSPQTSVDDAQKYNNAANSEPTRKVPGFIANRFRSGGTYGSAYSGADQQIKELEREGIPRRDPKADTESWREAAKELNIEVETDSIGVSGKDDGGGGATIQESASADQITNQSEQISRSRDDFARDRTASQSWENWRTGNRDWMQGNAKAPSRDPKEEVDMWRVSARELAAGSPQIDSNAATEATSGSDNAVKDSTAWTAWRDASKRWESSLENADMEMGDKSDSDLWGNQTDNADWGKGLNQRTSSDRSSWENWKKVKGGSLDSTKQSWWPTVDSKNTRSENNTDQWRVTASELVDCGNNSRSRKKLGSEVDEGGEVLGFWKTVAKDMDLTGTSADLNPRTAEED